MRRKKRWVSRIACFALSLALAGGQMSASVLAAEGTGTMLSTEWEQESEKLRAGEPGMEGQGGEEPGTEGQEGEPGTEGQEGEPGTEGQEGGEPGTEGQGGEEPGTEGQGGEEPGTEGQEGEEPGTEGQEGNEEAPGTPVSMNTLSDLGSQRAGMKWGGWFKILVNGEVSTEADLAGLEFTLYVADPAGSEYQPLDTSASVKERYGKHYEVTLAGELQTGIVNKEFKIGLTENAYYTMEEVAVTPSPAPTGSFASYHRTALNLIPKMAAQDNTEIRVDGEAADWSGTGTEDAPYQGKLLVPLATSPKNSVVLTAKNEKATFSCPEAGISGAAGSMTINRQSYGVETYNITVTAEDGVTKAYYQLRIGWNEYKTYHGVFQVRLKNSDGTFDKKADLTGLSFSLYESEDGGAWTPVSGQQGQKDEYSSFYKDHRVYFQSIAGASVFKTYQVRLEENDRYEMEPTTVGLNNINYNVSSEYFLDLTKKPASADNVSVSLGSLEPVAWAGTGTETDPWKGTASVTSYVNKVEIRTGHENAAIFYGDSKTVGSLDISLKAGVHTYSFQVVSADGTAKGYYELTVDKAKGWQSNPTGLKAVSPSQEGGQDGKIQNLDPARTYEYRVQGGTDQDLVQITGVSEITGLKAGRYQVRFAETEDKKASGYAAVEVLDPTPCKILLPKENIPDGVEILECPDTILAGETLQIQMEIPARHLLDGIEYTISYGSISSTSRFPDKSYSYQHRQDGTTLVTLTTDLVKKDVTLKILLKDGAYYQVETVAEGTAAEKADLTIQGESVVKGGVSYYKEGSRLIAAVKLKGDWSGYGEIAGLKAYLKGTNEQTGGDPIALSKDEWQLELAITADLDIHFSVNTYPADITRLDEVLKVIDKINLDRYLDNEAKETLLSLLTMRDAYQNRPLKEQTAVDTYVGQLQQALEGLEKRPQEQNGWVEELALEGWSYGDEPKLPTAKAKFGEPVFSYGGAAEGIYSAEAPQNAGTWYVKAEIGATEEYTGLTGGPTSFVIAPKKMTEDNIQIPKITEETDLSKLELRDGDKLLVNGWDYGIAKEQKDNTVTVTITFMGNYQGTIVRTYELTPEETEEPTEEQTEEETEAPTEEQTEEETEESTEEPTEEPTEQETQEPSKKPGSGNQPSSGNSGNPSAESGTAVKTADTAKPGLWTVVLLCSGLLAAGLLLGRKRCSRKQ